MILIAENFNSSIKNVAAALETRDDAYIAHLAQQLDQSQADYLDVNSGTFHDCEAETLCYLVSQIRQHTRKPLVLDSPNPETIRQAAILLSDLDKTDKQASQTYLSRQPDMVGQSTLNRQPDRANHEEKPGFIINSINLTKARYESMLSLALEHQAGLIALLMDDQGMPRTNDQRLKLADKLINRLSKAGLPAGYIFIDPMIEPVSTDDQAGKKAISAISELSTAFPDCHLAAGLSNISYGLPARRYLNRAFLLQAMAAGLDSPILNPLDEELMHLYRAGLVLTGQDEWCMNYLDKYR